MMSWTTQERSPSALRDVYESIRSFNPLQLMKTFIHQCRSNGMTSQETIVAVEERFNYFPTEAEIVVHEFWS